MFKKVVTTGIIALWLLIVPLIGNVLSQDQPTPVPTAEVTAPATAPSPEATPPAELTPDATAVPSPDATNPAVPSPDATAAPSPDATSPAVPSPAVTAPTAPTPEIITPAPVPLTPAESTGQETSAAAAGPSLDTGDTAFMLVSSALVLLMTPGLAFFYGGLVRSRNVLNTMMMSLILMAIVGVTWVFWGYSLAFDVSVTAPAFGQGIEKFIGGLDWLFLNNVAFDKPDPVGYAATIPHQVFMVYQMMFAIITPALISGAIVERMSFKAYFWFILLWSTFIYTPLAHWVWGRGWLGEMGALDFAGGTVVHISSGISAVVAAKMIGWRKSFMVQPAAPHNVPYVLLGIGLLWFGWFGFNAGSALGATSVAAVAFVATTVSTAAGGLTWVIMEWVLRGKPTAVGIASGFLAGLVGVTPGAGFVTPVGAILMGSITSACCFFAVSLRAKLQFDDSLDTFPVHGVGGTVGALLTGLFATNTVNPLKDAAGNVIKLGWYDGNFGQLVVQFIGVLATYIFAGVGTFVILKLLQLLKVDLRVKPIAEDQGLDINEHGEEGYGEEFASGLSFAKE